MDKGKAWYFPAFTNWRSEMATTATTMKVNEGKARAMFDQIGFAAAIEWSAKKLSDKLNSSSDLEKGDPQEPELVDLKEEILKTLADDGTIELEEEDEAPPAKKTVESNGHVKKGKPGKPGKKSAKASGKPQKATEPVKATKAAPGKKKGKEGAKNAKERKPVVRKAEMFGLSASSVIRWMGWNKFTKAEVDEALAHYKVSGIADTTVATAVADGRRPDEKWGKRAVLSKEQERELFKFHEAKKEKKASPTPSPAKKKKGKKGS